MEVDLTALVTTEFVAIDETSIGADETMTFETSFEHRMHVGWLPFDIRWRIQSLQKAWKHGVSLGISV